MQVLIKKCPNQTYLDRGTFSVSEREFNLIQDRPKEVVIEIYRQLDDSLYKTIKGRSIKKLIATPRQKLDDDGMSVAFYVIDFNEVK